MVTAPVSKGPPACSMLHASTSEEDPSDFEVKSLQHPDAGTLGLAFGPFDRPMPAWQMATRRRWLD